MTEQLKASILAAGDTYALAVHSARTGGESKAAKAIFVDTVIAALAVDAVPSERDTELFGVTPDGRHVSLGMIPTPPRMKARELVRETFGHFEDGDGSDAEMCFGAMESLIEHMGGNVLAAAPQPAAEPDVPTEREGWRWVPVEPTEAMWDAGREPVLYREMKHYRLPSLPPPQWQINPATGAAELDTSKGTTAVHVWRAMIAAAAPQPASEPKTAPNDAGGLIAASVIGLASALHRVQAGKTEAAIEVIAKVRDGLIAHGHLLQVQPASEPQPAPVGWTLRNRRKIMDDLMDLTNYGKAARAKLGALPDNFHVFMAEWLGDKPDDWKTMRVTGAQFNGRLLLPGTEMSTIVTVEEINTQSASEFFKSPILTKPGESLLESVHAARQEKRCEYCDGTGDVHTLDGEYRGRCKCEAGLLPPQK